MRNHYLASISTLARMFEEAFTKASHDLEDFLDHTYSTVSTAGLFPFALSDGLAL